MNDNWEDWPHMDDPPDRGVVLWVVCILAAIGIAGLLTTAYFALRPTLEIIP